MTTTQYKWMCSTTRATRLAHTHSFVCNRVWGDPAGVRLNYVRVHHTKHNVSASAAAVAVAAITVVCPYIMSHYIGAIAVEPTLARRKPYCGVILILFHEIRIRHTDDSWAAQSLVIRTDRPIRAFVRERVCVCVFNNRDPFSCASLEERIVLRIGPHQRTPEQPLSDRLDRLVGAKKIIAKVDPEESVSEPRDCRQTVAQVSREHTHTHKTRATSLWWIFIGTMVGSV